MREAQPLRQQQARRRQAEYLSTLNLSAGSHWSYPLKTFPRPKGDATRVIYTEYDLPRRTRQPHDVIVDSEGMAWYASFGEQILGKLDPRTGKVSEYPVPLLKPASPTGILGILDRYLTERRTKAASALRAVAKSRLETAP